MKTYNNKPILITNTLGITTSIYGDGEIITWKITCFGNA